MFYLTPQERWFVSGLVVIFIAGAFVQLTFKRDIAPVRWAHAAREFKIDINTARADQLQMLPGIGAKLARRIVEYRSANGPFKSLEGLREVQGITAKRLAHIKGLISL
ncbi:MAG: helix-hairpin-helix domain-containing protein [Candidatus Omnitrophica bacterium]|nr:helix-hairpin-helix domain-containing protein [Candidatus Omnitrophota bacterium]MDE2223309.1 helix-hairpin-helix domain-containing protein [Candidatus Omnitrophota bacterium]